MFVYHQIALKKNQTKSALIAGMRDIKDVDHDGDLLTSTTVAIPMSVVSAAVLLSIMSDSSKPYTESECANNVCTRVGDSVSAMKRIQYSILILCGKLNSAHKRDFYERSSVFPVRMYVQA